MLFQIAYIVRRRVAGRVRAFLRLDRHIDLQCRIEQQQHGKQNQENTDDVFFHGNTPDYLCFQYRKKQHDLI
jgi:hypothetical protein